MKRLIFLSLISCGADEHNQGEHKVLHGRLMIPGSGCDGEPDMNPQWEDYKTLLDAGETSLDFETWCTERQIDRFVELTED